MFNMGNWCLAWACVRASTSLKRERKEKLHSSSIHRHSRFSIRMAHEAMAILFFFLLICSTHIYYHLINLNLWLIAVVAFQPWPLATPITCRINISIGQLSVWIAKVIINPGIWRVTPTSCASESNRFGIERIQHMQFKANDTNFMRIAVLFGKSHTEPQIKRSELIVLNYLKPN